MSKNNYISSKIRRFTENDKITKVRFQVHIELHKENKLLIGDKYIKTDYFIQEFWSKKKAKIFIKQWLNEPDTLTIMFVKIRKFWFDADYKTKGINAKG